MPLESLWWADDMPVFTTVDKAKWKWTAMTMQPDFISDEVISAAPNQPAGKRACASR